MHHRSNHTNEILQQVLAESGNDAPRMACLEPSHARELTDEVATHYSHMKYGSPTAAQYFAKELAARLLNWPAFLAAKEHYRCLYLASSAYGSVPTASHALMEALAKELRQAGLNIDIVKIERDGGFGRTDYGRLTVPDREKAMQKRRIGMEAAEQEKVKGSWMLVVDDLRCSGAHERALQTYLQANCPPADLQFAYCIAFRPELSEREPELEERINHSGIAELADLLRLWEAEGGALQLNARLLKFVLLKAGERPAEGAGFFRAIGQEQALAMHEAAQSRDGYAHRRQFLRGFEVLEETCLRQAWVSLRRSPRLRNLREEKIVAHNLVYRKGEGFFCEETGAAMDEWIRMYSRFKFGGVPEIGQMGKTLASAIIAEWEGGHPFLERMQAAGERGEYLYLTAPGIRNVVSASNYLLREVGERLNLWLTMRGLPTFILKHLTRLGSGRDNYARLSAGERDARHKTTRTILPEHDYQNFPVHVFFLDDAEVTGTTLQRARKRSLEAGAKTFGSFLALRVSPEQARENAAVEHLMNQWEVKGHLCEVVADILSDDRYQPVQRMLRLLLHPENQVNLSSFLLNHVSDLNLQKLYVSAMGNDYLWIQGQADVNKNNLGLYGKSLLILKAEAADRGLIGENGLLR